MDENLTENDMMDDYEYERAFKSEDGFIIHAWFTHTDEYDFSNGRIVLIGDVYLESPYNPGACYYCESFHVEDESDDEAIKEKVFRIADAYAEKIPVPTEQDRYEDVLGGLLDQFDNGQPKA